MKRTLFLFLTLALSTSIFAQEKADSLWKFNGVTSLNLSQMALSKNWAAGGEGSFAGNALINLNANYISKDKNVSWTNELTMGYGIIKQGDEATRKSNDKIDFASKFGYKASEKWFYSGLFSFKTQFREGFANPSDENPISNFMAPGYMNLSLGMDFKPSETFTMLIAPLTGKMTFVMDEELSAAGAFGVPAGATSRAEFGGYVKIAYATKLMKNVKLNTKIDLFSNYLENPQDVDVNFDLILSFKVNEYISASFLTQMIYDKDIQFEIENSTETEASLQWKELFGLGLTYSF